MKKVITYGTYDLLHYGHIRLLEKAKALGDYLIVGVTADDFDKTRGKINVKQSLMERIEGVRATGLADEIIVEEYEGQKIDDIKKYDIDIFTVGSDWIGKFDYLNEYCKVVYLPRTEGVSSSEIRASENKLRIGIIGTSTVVNKVANEVSYVNGMQLTSIFTDKISILDDKFCSDNIVVDSYNTLLENVDAVYVLSHPNKHYEHIKMALQKGKHVICESPIAINLVQYEELIKLAKKVNCIIFDGLKTAYSTAYNRLLLLIKGGKIGKVMSVDATCTSLREKIVDNENYDDNVWNSMCAWGPVAMLPIFQVLGTNFKYKNIVSNIVNESKMLDSFTKIDFVYDSAVASVKIGKGIKSEGSLVISGTEGYVYVPAPWWKTDYFEIRYEDQNVNKRYYYQLDGEGIRYELVAFAKEIESKKSLSNVGREVSKKIVSVINDFYQSIDLKKLGLL